MKIILMRHGRPELDLDQIGKNRVSPRELGPIAAQYEQGDLAADSYPHQEALDAAQSCVSKFSSTLRRAVTSADRLGFGENVISGPIFNESPMPYPMWGWPMLGVSHWGGIFRIASLLGFSRNGEPIGTAKLRAANGVDLLAQAAQADGSAILVGHGIFNHLLKNELKRRGWDITFSNGSKYWSYTVFEKR